MTGRVGSKDVGMEAGCGDDVDVDHCIYSCFLCLEVCFDHFSFGKARQHVRQIFIFLSAQSRGYRRKRISFFKKKSSSSGFLLSGSPRA